METGAETGEYFPKGKESLIKRKAAGVCRISHTDKSWIAQQVASTDKIRTHPRNPF